MATDPVLKSGASLVGGTSEAARSDCCFVPTGTPQMRSGWAVSLHEALDRTLGAEAVKSQQVLSKGKRGGWRELISGDGARATFLSIYFRTVLSGCNFLVCRLLEAIP